MRLCPRDSQRHYQGMDAGWGRGASQHGWLVTRYLLPAALPQKTEGSKDQPKAVSLNHDTDGGHPGSHHTLITSALTFTLFSFPQPRVPLTLHELSHHASGHALLQPPAILSTNSSISPYQNYYKPHTFIIIVKAQLDAAPIPITFYFLFLSACQFLTHTVPGILGSISS